jgi:hypothetical protein
MIKKEEKIFAVMEFWVEAIAFEDFGGAIAGC